MTLWVFIKNLSSQAGSGVLPCGEAGGLVSMTPMLRHLFIGLFCLFATAFAQAAEEAGGGDLDSLKVGDVLPEAGQYWNLHEAEGQINLRYVGTRLRLYFVDTEGKIMEPLFPVALVRYRNDLANWQKTGQQMTKLTAGPGNVYLASSRVLPQPLRYRVWVVLKVENEKTTSMSEEEEEASDPQAYPMRILNGLGQ